MLNKDDIRKIIVFICCVLFSCITIKVVFSIETIIEQINKIMVFVRPFIFGFVFAYLLLPICNKVENILKKKRIKNNISSVIAIAVAEVLLVAIIIIVFYLIIPQLISSGQDIFKKMPDIMKDIYIWIGEKLNGNKELSIFLSDKISSLDSEIYKYINNNIMPNINNYISSILLSVTNIITIIANIIIGIVVSVFILNERKRFKKSLKRVMVALFGNKLTNLIVKEIKIADDIFGGFFVGKTIDSLIVGCICFISLLILNIPYAFLISTIVCITNVVPIFGPFIGAIPSAVIIFSESPTKSITFIIFIIILQQIDGHVIGPKLIGKATGLSTFWVLFALIVFGRMFGIVGMIIGVPLMAVIHDIFDKVIDSIIWKKSKKNKTNT